MIPAEIIVRDIPLDPGCLFALINFEPGAPVQGINIPTAMIGTKRVSVSTWAVLYWEIGTCYATVLKSEDARPWDLKSVIAHFEKYHANWRQVASNQGTAS